MHETLRILAGSSNPLLAEAIAQCLGVPLSQMLVGRFSDGEVRVKIEESLRGMDAFVVQSTCSPVNDNVMELLIIVDALRRASARRITCVMPYYGYARQDKKVKPREPVTARLMADLYQLAGANRILAMDLHAEQLQGFFHIPVDHLYARPFIANYLADRGLVGEGVTVVSPDVGGVARATELAERIDAQLAIIAKRRPEPNKAEILSVIGEVRGRTCILLDDMIDTGGSISQGAEALKRMGAERVLACGTHAVLSGNAVERLDLSPVEEVIVTDTIALPEEKRSPKIKVLSVAPLFAEAIDRIHRDGSVSELF